MNAHAGQLDARMQAVLATVVLLHLAVHTVHGLTHLAIPVILQPLLLAAVVVAMYALPLLGLVAVHRGAGRLGIATLAIALGLSLGLSGLLHFAVSNPDNVGVIAPGPWRTPFVATAVAILFVDGLGVVASGAAWRRIHRSESPAVPRSGRLAGVSDSRGRPFARCVYWLARRTLGDVPEPVTITAHHRTLLAGLTAFELALARANHVDDGLTELVALKAAAVAGCEYCLDVGTALAIDAGVSAEQLRELHAFETSEAFSKRERLALRYAEAMTATPVDVPDALFDAVAAEFRDTALVELTAVIAFENYRARFNHAFAIDDQDFAEGAFCPRPEGRVTDGETDLQSAPIWDDG